MDRFRLAPPFRHVGHPSGQCVVRCVEGCSHGRRIRLTLGQAGRILIQRSRAKQSRPLLSLNSSSSQQSLPSWRRCCCPFCPGPRSVPTAFNGGGEYAPERGLNSLFSLLSGSRKWGTYNVQCCKVAFPGGFEGFTRQKCCYNGILDVLRGSRHCGMKVAAWRPTRGHAVVVCLISQAFASPVLPRGFAR